MAECVVMGAGGGAIIYTAKDIAYTSANASDTFANSILYLPQGVVWKDVESFFFRGRYKLYDFQSAKNYDNVLLFFDKIENNFKGFHYDEYDGYGAYKQVKSGIVAMTDNSCKIDLLSTNMAPHATSGGSYSHLNSLEKIYEAVLTIK